MERKNLADEYREAVSQLVAASEKIDNTKGVAKNNAKLDFVIAQNNLLSIQMAMVINLVTDKVDELKKKAGE